MLFNADLFTERIGIGEPPASGPRVPHFVFRETKQRVWVCYTDQEYETLIPITVAVSRTSSGTLFRKRSCFIRAEGADTLTAPTS